jgi:predicted secreted Zn-dependent protease
VDNTTPAASELRGSLTWQVARSCNGGACVRVAHNGNAILIGDSKNPDGPVLPFTRDEWKAFVEGVRQGDFDSL